MSIVLPAQVVINEFSATNLCSIHNPNQVQDNFGRCEDWVELYNPTGAAIDLTGYHLTDRITNLNKWSFPNGSIIEANGFLRVWLSGRKGVAFNIANIHADFRLGQTQENEVIAFVAPDGMTILDVNEINTTSQLGHTRGRFPDGADNWVVFTTPTIGVSNNGSVPFLGYAPRPEFSVEAGYHNGPISVEITIPDANPDFTIRYTTDGTFPTETSPVYTGPINLGNTTVLMAGTYSADDSYLRSFYQFGTYFFGEDQHTLKVFSVSGTQVPTLLGGNQIVPLSTMEMFDENGQRLSANFGDTNKHGNDSWAYQQRGIDWIDRDKMGYSGATEQQMFRIKDRDSFKRYMFKAGANDNYPFQNGGAHIRDAYVMSLTQVGGLDLDERTVEFCALYVNGEYWGVYDYREKVDNWRFTEYYYDQGRYDIDFIKTWGNTWANYGDITDWNNLRNFITGNDMTDQTNYDYVKTQLNVISLIDYFSTNTWIVASDWLNWNTAWWKGHSEFGGAQKWRYTLWDMDASFGHYINYTGIPDTGPYADPCYGENLNNPGGQGHTQIMSALLENEEFFNTYINRYADHLNSVFSCEFAIAHLDSMLAIIEPEMPRQIARWGGTMNGWQNNVDALYDFIETRCAEVMVNGMEDCYDLTAIEVTIEIVGDGSVVLNSITITPDMVPWTGTYYAEVPFDLTAVESGNGLFQLWETLLGDLDYEDDTAFEITVNPDGNVTIVAHFEPLVEHTVTFDVFPANSGFIELNGNVIPTYPHTEDLTEGLGHDLVALAEDGWYFSHWESVNQGDEAFVADVEDEEVVYTVEEPDQVIAHFKQIYVVIRTEPEEFGTVVLDGDNIGSFWEGPMVIDQPYALQAVPEDIYYDFIGWQSLNGGIFTPNADASNTTLQISDTDTIIASFVELPNYAITVRVEPEGAGRVMKDWSVLPYLPWTGQVLGMNNTGFIALPNNEWQFSHWTTMYHTPTPSPELEEVRIDFNGPDEVVAHFVPREFHFYMPNSFSPDGDGINDIFRPVGNEWHPEHFLMQIFNRQGNLVFETNNAEKGWDGSEAGQTHYAQVQVYVYRVEVRNAITGENETFTGHVTVLR